MTVDWERRRRNVSTAVSGGYVEHGTVTARCGDGVPVQHPKARAPRVTLRWTVSWDQRGCLSFSSDGDCESWGEVPAGVYTITVEWIVDVPARICQRHAMTGRTGGGCFDWTEMHPGRTPPIKWQYALIAD